MVHIAGLDLKIQGRYLRQCCAWCGEVLIDVDASTIMVMDSDGDRSVPAWPVGSLIAIHGNGASIVEGRELPEDCCAILEIERPKQENDPNSTV